MPLSGNKPLPVSVRALNLTSTGVISLAGDVVGQVTVSRGTLNFRGYAPIVRLLGPVTVITMTGPVNSTGRKDWEDLLLLLQHKRRLHMNDTEWTLVRALMTHLRENGVKEFKVKWSDMRLAESSGQILVIGDEKDNEEFCTVTLLTKKEGEEYLNKCQEDAEEATCGCCMTDCAADVDADCEPVYEDAPKCNCNCGCQKEN
jgi:hypothetical protein